MTWELTLSRIVQFSAKLFHFWHKSHVTAFYNYYFFCSKPTQQTENFKKNLYSTLNLTFVLRRWWRWLEQHPFEKIFSLVTVAVKPHQYLTLRKNAIWLSKNCRKLDLFFQKNCQKLSFFQQNCQWQFCFKNVKFLAIFWHSNDYFPVDQVAIDGISVLMFTRTPS